MKSIIFWFSLLTCFISYADMPAPDDLLDKQYWATLDKNTKPVFLTGFRLGAGLNTFGSSVTPLTLHSDFIPKLVPLIDDFYSHEDNKRVLLRSAIRICLMQIVSAPKKDIEEATRKAREPQTW